MNVSAPERIRSQKASNPSYGSCGEYLLQSSDTEGKENNAQRSDINHHETPRRMNRPLQSGRSYSMSSSSSSDDDGSGDEELAGSLMSSLRFDEEAPPPPPPQGKWSPGCSRIRSSFTTKANNDSQSKKNDNRPSPLQTNPLNRHLRRVSFLKESSSVLPLLDKEVPVKTRNNPARSREFQDSWRRKSSRRISALLMTKPQPNLQRKKTAKEHWSLLREYVLTGKFFLDQSSSRNNLDCSSINTRPSYLQKRHSSIARSLTKEIQSGLEFSLIQCVTAICIYLILAVLCFSFLLEETRHDWTMIDSMYFAVAMFTTVGFGDLTPPRDSAVAHLLTSIFALSGVACLGIALGIIGHRLVEFESKAMDRAQKDVLSLFSTLSPTPSINEDSSTTNNAMAGSEDDDTTQAEIVPDIDILHQNIQRCQLHPTDTTLTDKLWTSTLGRLSFAHDERLLSDKKTCGHRKHLHQNKRPFQRSLKQINTQLVVLLGSIIIVSYLIGNDAGWNFTQTLYFAITTSCTIGFGDLVVTSQMGRLLVVIFIPIAVGAMGFLLRRIAEAVLQTKQRKHMVGLFGSGDIASPTGRQRQRELTVMDLEAMDSDGNGNVDWSEFLEFMLVAMKKVDEDLMWELRYQFDSLDVDGTGVLSKENLIAMARRRLQQTSHKLHLLQYKQHLLETGGSRYRFNGTSLRPEDDLV